MSKEIKNVEFSGIEFNFYCVIPHGCLNLGMLKLECEGRTFELDTIQSRWFTPDDAFSIIEVDLAVDEDVSTECKFDLTSADLWSNDLKATLWFDVVDELSDEYVDPDSITLYVKFINPDGSGCTKAIEIDLD